MTLRQIYNPSDRRSYGNCLSKANKYEYANIYNSSSFLANAKSLRERWVHSYRRAHIMPANASGNSDAEARVFDAEEVVPMGME